ncbi:MAG: DUF4892 domain-containing protein, partial [Acidobacteria bacterium]|nr:DUF4892 domain-containing protein [Acidobacteriota bacterium]
MHVAAVAQLSAWRPVGTRGHAGRGHGVAGQARRGGQHRSRRACQEWRTRRLHASGRRPLPHVVRRRRPRHHRASADDQYAAYGRRVRSPDRLELPTVTRAIPARLLVALVVVTGHAAEDLPGAADPPGLERFPGSWIVAYTPPAMLRSYEFVTGRVDRSGRTARVDDSMRLAAEVVRVTYRAADGTRFDEVVEHYRNQILDRGADVVFTCEARDCGRSTSWANSVFGVKELVAPDSSQFYLAARSPQPGSASGSPLAWNERTLIAVYVVQRGNRRIYAHVDLGTADAPPVATEDTALAGRLRQQGYAVVAGVVPALD